MSRQSKTKGQSTQGEKENKVLDPNISRENKTKTEKNLSAPFAGSACSMLPTVR